ncbi:Protein DEHYDRATION-INDUCED 19-like protein 2 [Dichanthelium oligosanthes]|uniref:Protein DEHYDRATION-INDUCED 19-like protein 2 n=1 Tax=Dichanthelium oligosanthes TaxID=888268 RepID=A0A1E5W9L5_9POAL|nr:Protein DEHYDRATION-INDUCED 19-like protein 2 [Dichanthelium oligosanthes]
MDMDAYEGLAAENRRSRGTRFEALIGLDEAEASDEEEEGRAAGAGAGDELPCPFCGEELDAVGLLCHMEDEHHAEANAGVCPICAEKVDMLVRHISSQHRSFLKDKWRNQQGSSGSRYSTLASLKRDLQERISGSSRAAPVSTVPDPLLSSFVGNYFEVDLPKDTKKEPLDETEVGSDNLDQKAAESMDEPLLPEVKVERTRRSQFVQGLVLSLIFDDIL